MKIKTVINQLRRLEKKYGNVEVFLEIQDYDDITEEEIGHIETRIRKKKIDGEIKEVARIIISEF